MKQHFYFLPKHEIPFTIPHDEGADILKVVIPLRSAGTNLNYEISQNIFSDDQKLFLKFDLKYDFKNNASYKFVGIKIFGIPVDPDPQKGIKLIQMRCEKVGGAVSMGQTELENIIVFKKSNEIDFKDIQKNMLFMDEDILYIEDKDSCTIPPITT